MLMSGRFFSCAVQDWIDANVPYLTGGFEIWEAGGSYDIILIGNQGQLVTELPEHFKLCLSYLYLAGELLYIICFIRCYHSDTGIGETP